MKKKSPSKGEPKRYAVFSVSSRGFARNKNLYVDHIDGDPTNNAPANLRIVTLSKNRPNI